MKLVAEPNESEDTSSYFDPTFLAAVPSPGHSNDGLMSPYDPNFLSRTIAQTSGLPTTVLPPSPFIATTPTSSLSMSLKSFHLPSPSPLPQAMKESRAEACPIVPSAFCMWAAQSVSNDTHVYSKLDPEKSHFPCTTTYVEDLFESETRFPGIVSMHSHMPCQFLHVRLPVSVPEDGGPELDRLYTQFSLNSVQDWPLCVVTTIYSYGTRVLNQVESLPTPTRLCPSSMGPPSLSSTGSTSGSELSPLTPSWQGGRPMPTGVKQHHAFSYVSPVATEFFSIFLRGALCDDSSQEGLPPFRKSKAERDNIAKAMSGVTVLQEFVIRSEDDNKNGANGAAPATGGETSEEGQSISPGSAVGDVALVVVYEFEVTESPVAEDGQVSFLSVRNVPQIAPPQPPAPALAVQNFATRPASAAPTEESQFSLRPPAALQMNRPPSFQEGRKRSTSNKLNLCLNIPSTTISAPSLLSASKRGEATPVTPWPQVVHTPTEPPPMRQPDSPTTRNRLSQAWAAEATAWDLHSPALMGAFPPLTSCPPSTSDTTAPVSDLAVPSQQQPTGMTSGMEQHHLAPPPPSELPFTTVSANVMHWIDEL
jgi:hypothetical protein